MSLIFGGCGSSHESIYDSEYASVRLKRKELKQTIKDNKKEYAKLKQQEKLLNKMRKMDKELNGKR